MPSLPLTVPRRSACAGNYFPHGRQDLEEEAEEDGQGGRRSERPRQDGRPGAVTTAVQAAGELAQIGLTVGGQILKRAARRLPRP
jgi:hypothetical protein